MPSVANVHVRDLPDALHLALKERAAMEGRSVNEVIVRALGRAAAQPTPAEFAAFLKADIARWAPLIKQSGAKAD